MNRMDVDAHFLHPLKTCRWAKKQIGQFEASERAFFKDNPGKEFSYVEFVTTQWVHGVEFSVRPTDELEEQAYRAVGDLRNSLDQAIYAACKSLGVDDPKRANFPIGDGKKHFERQLASTGGPYRDIPVAPHPKISGFMPYPPETENAEGNSLLRALAEMANPNKHHLPLGVEVQTGMKFYGSSGGVISVGTKWDWKGRTELYRRIPGVPYEIKMELEPRIAFGQVAGMAGKPVSRTLREMLPMVECIIGDLKTETNRLLAGGHRAFAR